MAVAELADDRRDASGTPAPATPWAGVTPAWVALPESTEEVAGGAAGLRRARPGGRARGRRHQAALGPAAGAVRRAARPVLPERGRRARGGRPGGARAGRGDDGRAVGRARRAGARSWRWTRRSPRARTVGGTLAAAAAGPRAFRYGTARDLLIGITVVLPDGPSPSPAARWSRTSRATTWASCSPARTARSGVIAEATFRLHPLPAERRWSCRGGSAAGRPAEPCQAGSWPRCWPPPAGAAAPWSSTGRRAGADHDDRAGRGRPPAPGGADAGAPGWAASVKERQGRAAAVWGRHPAADDVVPRGAPSSPAEPTPGGWTRRTPAGSRCAAPPVARPGPAGAVGRRAPARTRPSTRWPRCAPGGRRHRRPPDRAGHAVRTARIDLWGPVGALPLMRRVEGTVRPRARCPPRPVRGRDLTYDEPGEADQRLRALWVLPAHVPDVRAVGRGDGLPRAAAST